jgi:hypothetical protein
MGFTKSVFAVLALLTGAAFVGCLQQAGQTAEINDSKGAGSDGILGRLLGGGVNEPLLPDGYQSLEGCRKRDLLWERVTKSRHEKLPEFRKVDPVGLVINFLKDKMNVESDQAPNGYRKAIHAVGTVAKVRYSSLGSHDLDGLFADTDVCGLLRLSLTSKPGDVAPGLAFKLFVDGQPSANVSALVALDGQGSDHNFFAQEMTNVVASSKKLSGKFSSGLFSLVSKHPRKISVSRFAALGKAGRNSMKLRYPYQVYFVPPKSLQDRFVSKEHNVLEDLVKLNPSFLSGSNDVVYELWAVVPKDNGPSERDSNLEAMARNPNEYRTRAKRIGAIKLESEMVSSSYGDSALFFKHDRFENE